MTTGMYLDLRDQKEYMTRIAEVVPALRDILLDLPLQLTTYWRVARDPKDKGRISLEEMSREAAEVVKLQACPTDLERGRPYW